MASLSAARYSLGLFILGISCSVCSAQVITGTVRHGATGKPVAGDPVILLAPDGSARSRTLTASDGTFKFQLVSAPSPPKTMIIRVFHDRVAYERAATFGSALQVSVYDRSREVDGLSGYLSILQFQTQRQTLEVTELDAVRNDSKPPLTQVAPHNLDLALPEGAHVRSVSVAGPGGERLEPSAPGTAPPYQIDFPLRPGVTKYAVTYELPYKEKMIFRRRLRYPTKQISVVLPDSMQFISLGAHRFHLMGRQMGAQVETLTALNKNESLEFELSGTGVLAYAFQPADLSQPSAKPVTPPHPSPTNPQPIRVPLAGGNSRPEPARAGPLTPRPALSAKMRPDGLAGWVSATIALLLLGAVISWLVFSRTHRF